MLFKKYPFNNLKNIKNAKKKIKNFINTSNINVNDNIKHVIKIGLYISFFLVVLASIILFIYLNFNKNLLIYKLGLMILKLSSIIATAFIVSGLSVDRIRRDLF